MSSTKLQQARWKIDSILESYGSFFKKLDSGRYRAVQGSAEVLVEVQLTADEVPVVHFSAPVSYNAMVDQRDAVALLKANADLTLGAFAFDAQGAVVISYTMPIEHAPVEALKWVVRTIALAADGLDELISARTSGQRSIDAKPYLK